MASEKRRRRHLEFQFARAGEKVGHVGVEPGLVAADRPQAERAVGVLARQQAGNGVADALVDVAVERQMRLTGQLVDIEHGHGAAGDLLGAAERITVERIEQRRRIERGGDRDRQRDAPGAGHEIGEHVLRQRQRLALGQRAHGAAREDLRRWAHVERVSCATAQSRSARSRSRSACSPRRRSR